MSVATFQYRAINPTGKAVKGELRADGRQEAYRQILAAGLRPTRITTARSSGATWRGRRSFSRRDLAHFTHQFAVFLQARIPIADGLRSIAEQEGKRRLRAIIEDVASQIESGHSVTDSLLPHQDVFGEVYVETVRAAERSGNMTKILNQLGEMLEQEYDTSKRIRSALMYPTCVMGALVLAIGFLTVFVVPRFATMFASRGLDLPLPTQVIVGLSQFVRGYWWALAAGAVVGAAALRMTWHRAGLQHWVDAWLHKIPGVGDVLRFTALARFARVLGLTLQSGLGLVEALELSGRASARPTLNTDIQKMQTQVNRGGSLSDVVMACSYLPAFTRRMIVAGSEAAELPHMCELVARHYGRELDYLTKNLATLIEPIVVIGLAAIVLLVALAFFLPMWNMGSLIG